MKWCISDFLHASETAIDTQYRTERRTLDYKQDMRHNRTQTDSVPFPIAAITVSRGRRVYSFL